MKKQTAVEYLIQEINHDASVKSKSIAEWFEVFEKAKAMEREQIVDAFKEGLKSPYHQDYTLVTQEGQEETKSGQYYTETYGGKQ